MILDIQTRIIDGKPVLYKFAPTNLLDNGLTEKDGYLQFDIKRFSWQPVHQFILNSDTGIASNEEYTMKKLGKINEK